MKVLLPYPISTNKIWRRGAKGVIYQPAEVKEFKKMCAWLAKKAGAKVLKGDVEAYAILHPKITKKGLASKCRIDADNLKAVWDSLNGVCYEDDKQITKMTIEIGEAMQNGGVTVEVTERTA